MAPIAPSEEATPPARQWFRAWLKGHKRRNPHGLFAVYEADGDSVYQGWILAFEEIAATRAQAKRASQRLQRALVAKGKSLLPEHHLPRLLAILEQLQAPQRRLAEEAHRAAVRATAAREQHVEAQERATWALLPPSLSAGYRATVRRACPQLARRSPAFAEMLARRLWALEEAGEVEMAEALLAAWRQELSDGDQQPAAPHRRRPPVALSDCPEPCQEVVAQALETRRRQIAALYAQTARAAS